MEPTPLLPARFAGAHDVSVADGRVHFTVDSDRVAELLAPLGALDVAGLRIQPPSLEDLFLRHYDGSAEQ